MRPALESWWRVLAFALAVPACTDDFPALLGDGGARDASLDGAGPADASRDVSCAPITKDAAACLTSGCAGSTCSFDCATCGCTCDPYKCPTGPAAAGASTCAASCAPGTTCNVTCDELPSCSLGCEGCSATFACKPKSKRCDVTCAERSNCNVACESPDSCDLRCDATSQCLFSCSDKTVSCAIDCGGGVRLDCPGPGKIVACNRACPN